MFTCHSDAAVVPGHVQLGDVDPRLLLDVKTRHVSDAERNQTMIERVYFTC